MTVLVCPVCTSDMLRKSWSRYECPKCDSRLIQGSIDTRPLLHNLIDARKRAGMNEDEAARAIGITTVHYKRIEAGRYKLTVANKHRLAAVFGCGMEELE